MAKNVIRSSKQSAKKASMAMRSSSTSNLTKSLGGGVLVNRKKNTKRG